MCVFFHFGFVYNTFPFLVCCLFLFRFVLYVFLIFAKIYFWKRKWRTLHYDQTNFFLWRTSVFDPMVMQLYLKQSDVVFFFYYKLSTEIQKVTHKYFPIEISKQLNYFIPVLLVPLTIFSHIRRAFLPVPFFDWNLPIPAVVCHDIRFCFTRNSHLH